MPVAAFAQDIGIPGGEAAVPIVLLMPIMGGVLVVVVIAIALYFVSQREKRKQDLIARFADKGQDVPPSLLPPPPSPQRDTRRGIWLLSWGLGIGLVLFIATGDWEVAAWCLISLFLSAASFLNAALFYPKSGTDQRVEDGD